MQRSLNVGVTRSVLVMSLAAVIAYGVGQPIVDAQSTQAPGGFLEAATSTAARAQPTASQIAAFVPATRGRFYFPAPYNTEAYRLSVPADCNGGDCVEHTGYSDWRNINNHAGRPDVRVFISLSGETSYAGPNLYTINKATGVVTNNGQIFAPGDPLSGSRAEGWYWSANNADIIYAQLGPRLVRVNVATGQQTTAVDLTAPAFVALSGTPNVRVWSPHSADTDQTHVGTVRLTVSPYSNIGCFVYKENLNQWSFFPTPYDCYVDKSGRYFIQNDTTVTSTVHVRDLETGAVQTMTDPQGAPGHQDRGHGYWVGEDNFASSAQALRLWDFTQPFTAAGQGLLVHSMPTWGNSYVQPAFGSALPRTVRPINQQYMCSLTTFLTSPVPAAPREREIVCFRLDGSRQMLVVAPSMTDMAASGGGMDYNQAPKGNIDTSGEYYVWTTNMGGNRLEAFLVRIPYHLLTGGGSGDTTPPTVNVTAPGAGASVSGSSVTLSANAADNVGVVGVQFRVDGAPIGAEDTAAPFDVAWNSTSVANGGHTVTATARDAAGNVTTSSGVAITVSNGATPDTTPPSTPGGLTATAVSSAVINLSWTASTDNVGVAGYRIYRGATQVGTSGTTSYSDAGLSASTAYSYTVRAYDAANNLSNASAAASATTLPPGSSFGNLIAAFGFNEGSGTLTSDSSPLQSVGTLTNASWTGGQLAYGLAVSGAGYANVPDVDGLTPGVNATFETWVYLNAAPSEPASLFNKWSQSVDDEYMVALTANRNVLFSWKTTGATTWGTPSFNEAVSSGQVPVGAWTHVAVVRAGAVLSFYINGALSSSVSAMDNNPFRNGTNSLRMGGQGRGANRFFNGTMDSARIYNRALTVGEVQIDMNTPVQSPTLLAGGGQPVIWTNLVNTSAWAATLRKTGGCDTCADATALSTQQISSGDGALEFVVSKRSTETWVGLSGGNTGSNGAELRFGLRLVGTVAEVRELGTHRTSTPIQAGDVLRIAISGGVVRYARNNAVFYTSAQSLSYPLVADSSLLDFGSEITNAMITLGTSSAPALIQGPSQSNRAGRRTLAPAASGGGNAGTHGSGGVIQGSGGNGPTRVTAAPAAKPGPLAGGAATVDSPAVAKWAANVLGDAGDEVAELRLYAVNAAGEVFFLGSAVAEDLGDGRRSYSAVVATMAPGAYQILAVAGEGDPRQLGTVRVVIGGQ